jgi:hypothetical protein
MLRLVADNTSARRARYVEVLIPALEVAAGWFSFSSDPKSLQIMFDFHTISEGSQLGTIRAVRDETISQIEAPTWSWDDHVRTVRIENHDCRVGGDARTVHAELDVPWFLEGFGPGRRAALMDKLALTNIRSRRVGAFKFCRLYTVFCKSCFVGGHGR